MKTKSEHLSFFFVLQMWRGVGEEVILRNKIWDSLFFGCFSLKGNINLAWNFDWG